MKLHKVPKFVYVILTKSSLLSTFSLIICLLYTLYAFSNDSAEKTRISENALLPGLVEELFNDSQMISIYLKRLEDISNDHKFKKRNKCF